MPENVLQDLPSLRRLDLSYNNLIGTIPPVQRGPFLAPAGGNTSLGSAVLAPQRSISGICGSIPERFNVSTVATVGAGWPTVSLAGQAYMPESVRCPRLGAPLL